MTDYGGPMVLLIAGLLTLLAAGWIGSKAESDFTNNTYGYIISAENCLADEITWNYVIYGSIDVSFQSLPEMGPSEMVNMTIFPPDECYRGSCCRDWVGEKLMFDVSYTDGAYTVLGISDVSVYVSSYSIFIGGFVALLGLFFVFLSAFMARSIYVTSRHSKYIPLTPTHAEREDSPRTVMDE